MQSVILRRPRAHTFFFTVYHGYSPLQQQPTAITTSSSKAQNSYPFCIIFISQQKQVADSRLRGRRIQIPNKEKTQYNIKTINVYLHSYTWTTTVHQTRQDEKATKTGDDHTNNEFHLSYLRITVCEG